MSHAISVPLTCNRVPLDVLQSETHPDGGIGWATEDQLRLAWACKPRVYLGDYSVRGRGTRVLAKGLVSGPEEDLTIQFNPAIEPGQTGMLFFVDLILSSVFINGQHNSWRMVRIPSVMSDPPCV